MSQRTADQEAGQAERKWKEVSESSDIDSEVRMRAEQEATNTRKISLRKAEEVAHLQLQMQHVTADKCNNQITVAVLQVWLPVHERNAQRLLRLCRRNAGVYVKLGQHLSQLDYILPRPYTSTLSAMLDDAPCSTFADVCKTIEEDFGQEVGELFEYFSPDPVASASLAQVHVAHAKGNDRKLAVKVSECLQVHTYFK